MGNCVKKKTATITLSRTYRLQAPMQTLAEERDETLTFRVDIFRWKIRGFPPVLPTQDTYFLKAWWTALDFETTEAKGADIAWDAHWQFAFQAGPQELKGNSITVMLFSTRKQKPMSKLTVKLWDIATGPSLQNFAMQDDKGKVLGRISFKALMRQETELVLTPSSVSLAFSPEKKGGKYVLVVRAVTEDGETEVRLPSSDALFWDPDADPTSLYPLLTFPATIETLRNASLQLRIFKCKKTNAEQQVAECWLTFSKMFKQEKYTVIKRDGPGYRSFNSKKESEVDLDTLVDVMKTYTVTRAFHEKLWFYGKEIGTIQGFMTLMNIPLISQLITGVNTENGFMAQSSNFVENSTKTPKPNQRTTVPQEILKIMALTEDLTSFTAGEKREGGMLSSKGNEIREHINQVKELIALLRESKKHSMISFIYENKTDLILSQATLLDLGDLLLSYADVTAYAVRPFYYEALVHLARRGELDLGSLAITEDNEKQRGKRIPVGMRYRSFLRNLLNCALGKLKIKGVDKRSQQFTEFVCAICYFRIPEFRKTLLQCLKEKSYESTGEWHEISFGSQGDIEDDDPVLETHILPMFDWTHLFYRLLPTNPEEDKDLQKALLDPAWKNRVAKRGVAYFRLISELTLHIKKLFPEKHIPWLEIPGYGVVIKTFLLEMKLRKLTEYPLILEQCSCHLLNNPELISVFIKVLFGKANVYRVELVTAAFELCDRWFTHFYEESTSLPTSFDEAFFLQGLQLAISCDIGFNIGKAIWFLYRNYQMMQLRTRQEVVLHTLLAQSSALTYALHWSRSVRLTYWNLLFFRLISLKFVRIASFEQVDEDIYTRAAGIVSLVHTTEGGDIEEDLKPYIPYSKADLMETKAKYEEWLPQIQADLIAASGKKGAFCGLNHFPFPEMTIENALVDKSESRMEEEW